MLAEFVHLRVHSAYSLAEGAMRIPDMVSICKQQKMPAIAITDTSNLFGALEFSLEAAKEGVQPIIGCQVSINNKGVETKSESLINKLSKQNISTSPSQLVLLVQNEIGYRNLLHLVSYSYASTDPLYRAQLSLEELHGHTEGLIALSGGTRGELARLIKNGQNQGAQEYCDRLKSLFPNRLYIELQRHGLDDEVNVEEALVNLAYTNNLPLVATNEVFFSEADMYEAHDALLCISEGSYVSESRRRRVTPEHRFKTSDEMKLLFEDIPEAISNTKVIAKRCGFMPKDTPPKLPPFKTGTDVDENTELFEQAKAGLEKRLNNHVLEPSMDLKTQKIKSKPYIDRLNYELQVIEDMGYSGYFLIVSDFIKWSKVNDIAVGPGRGSGAGSLVAWALTITDLDPLRWGLFFERFLNPERVSMPDFDIDFCQARRDEVIHYVQERYGFDRVAQIITFGKLQARAVVRDVGRVLEMPYGLVDRIAKLVPANPANPVTLQQAIEIVRRK